MHIRLSVFPYYFFLSLFIKLSVHVKMKCDKDLSCESHVSTFSPPVFRPKRNSHLKIT